jgi:hypothetical protein
LSRGLYKPPASIPLCLFARSGPTMAWRRDSSRCRPRLLPSAPDQAAARKRARASLQHSAARTRKPRPPLPFFSRHTPRPGRPIPSPHAPSPAYKRPPFLNGKMHTTSLSLLDIVSHSFASWFELAGAGQAPGRPAVPGVPVPPSSCRLDEVDKEKICRGSASPPPPSSSSASSSATEPYVAVGELLRHVRIDAYRFSYFFLFFPAFPCWNSSWAGPVATVRSAQSPLNFFFCYLVSWN